MSDYYLLNYNPGTPQYTFPRRGANKLSGTAIVHTAECAADNIGEDTSAEGCANMIANRSDYGSYHRLVDSDSIINMLPWEYEAWQDSETNNWAVGISAALRTSDWLTMPQDRADSVYRNMARCAADFVSHMKVNYGIEVPLRRISGAEARARVPGFCAHGDSGIARSDPGANFDWDRFFRYTREILTGTLTETTPKESKVLIIATAPEENGKHWIGDGVTRRHIPNPQALQDYQNVAHLLNILDNGRVQQLPAEVLGLDVSGSVNTFTAGVVNQRAAELVQEVRNHTAHNANRVLDILAATPELTIDPELLEKIRADIKAAADESLEAIEAKLSNLKVTLEVVPTTEGA